MKRKQITAILLSAIMTVTACMPMNSISAVAAETSGAGNTETAAVVEMQEEEAPAEEAEPDTAVAAQEVQEEQSVEAEPAAAEPEEAVEPQESEEPEAEVTEEAAEETEDAETVSESDAEEATAVSGNTAVEETEEAAKEEEAVKEEVAAQEETASVEPEEDQEDAAQEGADAQTNAEEIVEEEEPEITKGKEAKKAENPTAADFDNAADLEIGSSADVSVSEENPYMYFRITPDETAYYRICSEADGYLDTYGTLYGADQSEITYDDDAAGNGHFEIVCVLAAGRTYYLRARLIDITSSGSFTVRLEKSNEDVDFYYEGEEYNAAYYLPGKEVTLSVFAYSTTGEIVYSWTDREGNTVAGNTDEYTFEPQEASTVYCTATNGAGGSFTWTFDIINDNNLQLNVEESYYKVNYGNPVTLRATVTAVDMSQLQYQWYRCEGEYEPWGDNQWVKIDGANQTEYTVEKVESAEVYQFSVTDQFGSGRSNDIRVSVENHFSAYIIEGPEGEEYKTEEANVYVSPKETTTLSVSVEADNKEGITYKWYEDGDEIAGAASADYKTEAVTARADYYCVVSDRFGNSDHVTFYVVPYNQLYAYYLDEDGEKYSEHDVYVSLNGTATLSVGVDALDKNGITYKWYDGNYIIIEGADGAEFTTEPVTENRNYYCCVEDNYGNSSEVKFTVGVDTHLEAYPEGNKGKTYADIYANGAQSVTLRVVASADEGVDLQYQWYDNSLDEEMSETSAEYVVDPVSDHHYTCNVTDSYGNRIKINFYVYKDSYDNNLYAYDWDGYGSYCYRTVDHNGSKTLGVEVEANDTSAITYEWQQGPIDSDDEGFVTIGGATTNSFTIENAESSATYKCIVRDQYGSEATVTYKVRIDNDLYIYADEDNYSYSARFGVTYGESKDLTTSVHANDKEGLTYQWYVGDHDNFEDAQTIDGATSTSYHVDSVVARSYYYCEVTDKYGNTDYCTFTLYVQNHLIAYPYGNSEGDSYADCIVVPGESITLKTMAKADDESQLTYKWYDDYDEPLDSDPGKPSEYTIENVVSIMDCYCVVSDQYGNQATVYFSVEPDSKLEVSAVGYGEDKDVYVSVTPGQTKTLQVKASVTYGSMRYKWLNDEGEEIDKGTIDGKDATLEYEIESVTGLTSYSCEVHDDYGHFKNIYFEIRVENHLEAYPEGAAGSDSITIYAKPNTKVTLHTVATADDMTGLSYDWWYYGEESIDTTKESITIDAKNTSIDCDVRDRYGNYKHVEFNVKIENHLEAYPEGAGLDQFGDYVDFVDLTPSANQELTLKVNAKVSAGGLKYFWEQNKAYTTIWGEIEYLYEGLDDETGNTLNNVTAGKSTDYRCTVKDDYGNEETVYFHIHVGTLSAYPEGAEVVNGVHNNRAVITTSGGSTTLRVITNKPTDENLTYKWTEGELNSSGWWPLADGMNDSGKELVINATESKRYLCVVTDQFGNQALSYFNVNVGGIKLSSGNGTPIMTGDNKYELDVPVEYNAQITLKTLVEGDKQGLSFKWMEDDDGGYYTLDETSDSLTVKGGDAYQYKCKVSNANGSVATITYNMRVKTTFTAKPAGSSTNSIVIRAAEGESVTMKVAISGQLVDDWKYFEWSDSNGNYLGGGHDDFLTVKVLGTMYYTCKVHDKFGNEQVAYFHILTKDTSISSTDITVSPASYTYDGKAKTPAVTVKYKGSALVVNKDYKVAYSNNVNAGTGKVTVTGITLSGSVSKNFTIAKGAQAPAATASAVAAGRTGTFTVTGSYGALSVKTSNAKVATVTVSGKTVKVKGVAPGTATITITAAGDGNHNAKAITCSVKILPAATKTFKAANVAGKGIKLTWAQVAGANGYIIYRNNKKIKTITSGKTKAYTDTGANTNGSKYTYKIYAKASTGTSTLYKSVIMYKLTRPAVKSLSNSAAKKITVKWAKNAKAKGYQIQYGLKSNFSGAKTAKVTSYKTVSKVIGSLKKGKTYYVRIRTYKTVSGKTYYSAWSASKKVKISK